MIASYFGLIKNYYRFFIFSITGIFFSAPGQTFLISLTIPTICTQTHINPLQFAQTYSLATLLASFLLPFIGRKIDIWSAKRTLLFNAFFFSSAMIIFSIAQHIALLFIALFLLRLFGQGALTLTATSHTIKQFIAHRGAALSLTQLGYPLSELAFPAIYFFLFNLFGLSLTFIIFSFAILLLYIPITSYGIQSTITHDLTKPADSLEESKPLSFALKDPFFPFYVLISSTPPIMMTAALYFQMTIFENQAWAISAIPTAIIFYATFKLITTIIVGPLIDRIGVVIPLSILTLAIGFSTYLISLKGPIVLGFVYYACYGIGIGASAATMSYLWGLLYGAKHIAQIKGVIAIIRNGGTALSPILFATLYYTFKIPLETLFQYAGIAIIILGLAPSVLKQLDSRLTIKRS
jgi:MFS family permease